MERSHPTKCKIQMLRWLLSKFRWENRENQKNILEIQRHESYRLGRTKFNRFKDRACGQITWMHNESSSEPYFQITIP